MDIEQIKRITCRWPSFAFLSLDGKIRPLVGFLLSFGLSNSDVATILIKFPPLSGLSLSRNKVPTMKFLEKLGLDKKRWAKVLRQHPAILSLSRQKLEAVVDFLLEMGLSAKGAGSVLTRLPQITGYSLDNNLRPKAEYFRSLGVQIDVFFLRCPPVFGLSIEGKLKPTTEFFLERGYSMEQIASMASRFGAIYMLSLSNNLIPKWEFFLTMNYSKEEIVKFPRYFGYSLERRIRPRYAIVKASGVRLSLIQILLSEPRFAKALKNKMEKKASADASVAEIHMG